jgi:hypothetical protein
MNRREGGLGSLVLSLGRRIALMTFDRVMERMHKLKKALVGSMYMHSSMGTNWVPQADPLTYMTAMSHVIP